MNFKSNKPTLSFSKIDLYLNCPRRYKFYYIDALASKFKKEQPYFSLGESIHSTLYKFFNLPVSNRSLEVLKLLLRNNWVRSGFKDAIEERDYAHKGLNILENFYNTFDMKATPLYLEKNFSIDFEKFRLWGKIDRIDKLEDGALEIIDYKTSNFLPSIEEVKEDLQLAIYGVAVKKDLKTIPTKFSFIYLQHNEKLSVFFTEEELIEIENFLINTAEQIESDKIYEPIKNQFCYNCEFAVICPMMNPTLSDEDITSPDNKIKSKLKLEKILYEKEKAVESLYLMNSAIQEFTAILEKEPLLKKILEVFVNITKSKYGMILTADENNEFRLFHSVYYKENEKIKMFEYVKNELNNLTKIKVINKDETKSIFKILNIEEILIVPIFYNNEIKAIIILNDKSNGMKFNDNELIFINTIAGQAATTLKNALLYELAITDGLTKLFIHRHFINRLNEELARAERYNLNLSLLMLDIDHFKNFNDKYGHQIGDIVLKQFASILKNSAREIDVVARYGGEEFAIILPETDITGALIVAERTRKNVEEYVFKGYTEPLKVTTSIGVSQLVPLVDTQETLIKKSDDALYKAKNNGRNRVEVY